MKHHPPLYIASHNVFHMRPKNQFFVHDIKSFQHQSVQTQARCGPLNLHVLFPLWEYTIYQGDTIVSPTSDSCPPMNHGLVLHKFP